MHNGEASLEQTDTSKKALARQVELFRAMTPEHRLELAFSLSHGTREMSLVGLQRLHPTEDDLTLRIRLAGLMYGPAAAERISAAIARRRSGS